MLLCPKKNMNKKKQVNSLILIISINIIFDVITGVLFSKGGTISLVRAFVIYSVILYNIINKPMILKYNIYIVLLIFQTVILLFVSNDFAYAIRYSSKVFASMLLYLIAFDSFTKSEDIVKLSKSIVLIYAVLIFNYIISNVLNIGVDVYSSGGDFLNGNLYDSWNTFTYALIYSPLVLSSTIRRKRLFYLYFIIIILLIILVMSMKRTAIAGIILSVLIYYAYGVKNRSSKYNKVIIVSLLVLLFASPLYMDKIENRFYTRSDKMNIQSVSQETRYAEIDIIVAEVFNSENMLRMLFGDQAFNSPYNYANGAYGNRQLHVDYFVLLHGNGLLGLILYLMVFYTIFRDHKRYFNYVPKDKMGLILKPLFISLFLVQFLTSFGGQFYGITFRSLIFIGLGAINGYSKCMYSQKYSDQFHLKDNGVI